MPIRAACLSLLAAALIAAPAAFAGTPGKWTQLGEANLRNIDEAAMTRTADGTLHVVWTHSGSNGAGDDLIHDAVGPNGVVAPPNLITSGWATITSVPDVVTMPDGSLRAFFGGLHSTNSDDPNLNMNTATAPPSGAAWTVPPGTIVKGDSAYAGDDGAAVGADGTAFLSFGGTGAGTFVHRGLDPNAPDFSLQDLIGGGCCGYSPDVAVDQKSGQPFAVWYSNATEKEGVWAVGLDPGTGAPNTAPMNMPGSVTNFQGTPSSSQQLTRTPVVARAGGGVYAAYSADYPRTRKVIVWAMGAPKSATVAFSDFDHIGSLAADPEGRIWALWIENSSPPQVFARRSNKNVTKFGPAVKIKAPAGQQSAYKIGGNAQSGVLDVVALFGGINTQAQFHTQFRPGLGITASPKKIKRGKATAVKFTVRDPDAVKGAKVSAGGHTATTDGGGHATITLGPTKKKAFIATATKTGYTPGQTKVKVVH